MIRLIVALLFVLVFFIVSIILYPVYLLIGKFNINTRHKISLATIQWVFRVILFICGVKVEVKGRENVPDGPVLYVANHRGIFDILVGYISVDRLTGFISKKEVKKVPFLSWWMYFMNCLFLDRSSAKAGLKTILKAIELEKNGISIFIFPEGTRSKDGNVADFKAGSFKIAEKAGVPVVPIAINHTEEIFENHKPFVRGAHVTFEYCEPIMVNDLSKEEKKQIAEMARNQIVSKLS